MGLILVVDDVSDVSDTVVGILQDEGYIVHSASIRASALRLISSNSFSVAILDVRIDESDEDNADGLRLMHEINLLSPSTAIIILTGYGTKEMVREALRPDENGWSPAYDFLDKTGTVFTELPNYIRRAMQFKRK